MIHDVDKHNDDRGTPMPNTTDVHATTDSLVAKQTISSSYSANNAPMDRLQMQNNRLVGYDGNGNQITELTNTHLTFGDGSNIRLLAGPDSTGQEVVKISKSGFDAPTATNDQLLFNSNQDVFKINSKSTVNFSLTSGGSTSTTTVSITHGLGYIPIIFPTVNITTNQISGGQTGTFTLPYNVMGVGGGTTNVFVVLGYVKLMQVTTTTATFEIGIQGASLTIAGTITAYILQETAS